MSKDFDFIPLDKSLGTPPQIIWLRCGNTSNARLKEILLKAMHRALDFIRKGEPVVEITHLDESKAS